MTIEPGRATTDQINASPGADIGTQLRAFSPEILIPAPVRTARALLHLRGTSLAQLALNGSADPCYPGDMPDLHSLHFDVMDCDMWAVTDCRLGFIDHSAMQRLCAEQPRVAAALWRATVVDAAIYRQWVTNLGQRPAINRLAHLLCEMMLRMDAIGRVRDSTCALPITQADLSDASGLSVVHVNRTLQDLREMKLISFARGQLTIHDWDALAGLADFRPEYLHQLRRNSEPPDRVPEA